MKKTLITFSICIIFINSFLVTVANVHKKTIMIDLDGVLSNYSYYTDEILKIKKEQKNL